MGLPADIKPAISMIADVILPLEEWIKEPGKFLPDEPKPWRDPYKPKLSAENLGFLEHFDAILTREESFIDSYDIDEFLQRAAALVDDPLAHCPLGRTNMAARRLAWGFRADDDNPKFAANLGDNVDYLQKKESTPKVWVEYPVSRQTFYDACWKELRVVINLHKPSSNKDWQVLVSDLRLDAKDEAKKTKSGWDATRIGIGIGIGIESSQFIVALARDIVAYVLSHKCKAPSGADWASAVPIELGERRRPGNAFTAKDTEDAVKRMKAKLDELGRCAARATGATK